MFVDCVSLKKYQLDVFDEWCEVDANWKEWEGPSISASRKRILMLLWFGEAWKRVCEVFPFEEVFTKMGCGLTATGKGDELIRLQGLDDRPFTFDQNDRFRHVKTGLLPDIIPEVLLIISLILNAVTLTLIVGHNAAIC